MRMWRFALRETGWLLLALIGAGVLAAIVSTLAVPGATADMHHFVAALGQRCLDFARLDFGFSSITGTSAVAMLARGLAPTLVLLVWGAVIAVIVGAPVGIIFARGPVHRPFAPLIQVVAAMPVFCVGLALIWFAVNVLHWPASARGDAGAALGLVPALLERNATAVTNAFRILAVPALIVGAAGAASLQLALRRAAAEAGEASYRQGLKLMGLSALEIERVYRAPQIAAGVLASLGEIVLALISAAAIAEWVFDWPGDAVLFVKSVALHDWTVAALVLLLFAAIKLVADFIGALGAHALAEPDGEA